MIIEQHNLTLSRGLLCLTRHTYKKLFNLTTSFIYTYRRFLAVTFSPSSFLSAICTSTENLPRVIYRKKLDEIQNFTLVNSIE